MTNKELQEKLKIWPDDFVVNFCIKTKDGYAEGSLEYFSAWPANKQIILQDTTQEAEWEASQ